MIRLKFSKNPLTNLVRFGVLVWIAAIFVFKIDLTRLIFKKSVEELKGPNITQAMTTNQYEEILKLTSKPIEEKVSEVQPVINNEKVTSLTVTEDNRIFVPVTIGYRGKMVTVQMLLDTGATGVLISRTVAKRLGIKPEDTTTGTSIVADGRHVINHNTEVAFVAVGPKTKKPLQIHIMNRENEMDDGLLGMSFLAEFPHMIDMQRQLIKWM